MKINGQVAYQPKSVTVHIPREGFDGFIFKFVPVVDWDAFNKLCPAPVPPTRLFPGGRTEAAVDAPAYQKALGIHNEKMYLWMFLQSIKQTEGLAWDTVKEEDPSTWANMEKELKEAGLTSQEIGVLFRKCSEANILTDEMIDEARKSFLAGQAERRQRSRSQSSESQSTESGEPVKG